MSTWTNVTDTVLEPGQPIRSVDIIAIKNNILAVPAGAANAPRIADAALDTTVTNAGTNWVLNRTAGAVSGVVGTYALLRRYTNFGFEGPDLFLAGSNLGYSNGNGAGTDAMSRVTPSGTWRSMGRSNGDNTTSNSPNSVTLYLRIV
jgi:hypothetical protein